MEEWAPPATHQGTRCSRCLNCLTVRSMKAVDRAWLCSEKRAILLGEDEGDITGTQTGLS